MRPFIAVLLTTVMPLSHAAGVEAAAQASVATVKAAFLYNFAKFTEWPATALGPGQPLSLCVIGDRAVADALEETIRGRSHEGHELAVRVLDADGPLHACHLLYVDGRDAARASRVLGALRGAPVLTVGDQPRFAENGGVAQLVLEDDRMRFTINVAAVERNGLRLSSRLLGLARIVRDRDHGPV